jgi:hypothetical protein
MDSIRISVTKYRKHEASGNMNLYRKVASDWPGNLPRLVKKGFAMKRVICGYTVSGLKRWIDLKVRFVDLYLLTESFYGTFAFFSHGKC